MKNCKKKSRHKKSKYFFSFWIHKWKKGRKKITKFWNIAKIFWWKLRKKILKKISTFQKVFFPWFFLKEQQGVEKGRKECSETSSYLGRQKCLTCASLLLTLGSWKAGSFGGATQKVTLHSYNKNVAWLETGSLPPKNKYLKGFKWPFNFEFSQKYFVTH